MTTTINDVPALNDGYRQFTGPAELHKSLMILTGLLRGIGADAIVNDTEREELENWCALHEPMLNKHPYSEIVPLIREAIEDGVFLDDELQDILWLCDRLTDDAKGKLYYDFTTACIQSLQGILYGIISDGIITDSEICALGQWLRDNDFLTGTYPFDEVQSLLASVLEDGKVTDAEREELKAFFSVFVDPSVSFNLHESDMQSIRDQYSVVGICALGPDIQFEGKRFCITGAFAADMPRSHIEEIIRDHGGVCTKGVSNVTDYLIVGSDGNPCWAYACYGRKIEKAIMLRRSGGKILIVSEVDFWDALVE